MKKEKTIMIRLDEDIFLKLKKYVEINKTTMSDLIRSFIYSEVNNSEIMRFFINKLNNIEFKKFQEIGNVFLYEHYGEEIEFSIYVLPILKNLISNIIKYNSDFNCDDILNILNDNNELYQDLKNTGDENFDIDFVKSITNICDRKICGINYFINLQKERNYSYEEKNKILLINNFSSGEQIKNIDDVLFGLLDNKLTIFNISEINKIYDFNINNNINNTTIFPILKLINYE